MSADVGSITGLKKKNRYKNVLPCKQFLLQICFRDEVGSNVLLYIDHEGDVDRI